MTTYTIEDVIRYHKSEASHSLHSAEQSAKVWDKPENICTLLYARAKMHKEFADLVQEMKHRMDSLDK